MLCSEWSLVKRTFNHDTVIPLRCRCWSCDECRPIRTYQLVQEAKAGLPDLFITLTWKTRVTHTPDQAAVELAHAWRKIRAKYLRLHGKGSMPFLAVFERTKKGQPHIHIVARCKWLKHSWLKKQLKKEIQSPVCWIERIHGKSKIAYYISKYISKNPERFIGVKRYWRSHDYLDAMSPLAKMVAVLAPGWEIFRMHFTEYAALSGRHAYAVEVTRNSAEITYKKPP